MYYFYLSLGLHLSDQLGFAVGGAKDINIRPVHQNKIGLLIDSGTEPDLIARHLQAADAAHIT